MHSEESKSQCGWTKLYHPSGALVTLPTPPIDGSPQSYFGAFTSISSMITAGFTVAAPGMEPGEQVEQCLYCVRREKENEDKSMTPMIDVYAAHEAVKFAIITVYLNDDAAIADFERYTGLQLAKMPIYEGDNKIERGATTKGDKYVCKAPRPFAVVMMPNPRYVETDREAALKANKTYTIPKRKFVRWMDAKPTAANPPAQQQQTTTQPAQQPQAKTEAPKAEVDPNSREANTDSPGEGKPSTEPSKALKKLVEDWTGKMRVVNQPSLLNGLCQKYLSAITDRHEKRAVWSVIKAHAEGCGWVFDAERKEWNDPKEDRVIPF